MTTQAVNQSPGGCGCGPPSCQVCTHVVECHGSDVAGETVTVVKGGIVVGTCTTDAFGRCCVDVSATGSGSYKVSCAKTGYFGASADVTVTCPGITNVTLESDLITAPNVWAPTVQGCYGYPLPGAVISIKGGTYTTNSSGQVGTIPLPIGSWPFSIVRSRFVTQTGTIVVPSCTGTPTGRPANPINMVPATGYQCCAIQSLGSSPTPIATALFVSDSGGSMSGTLSAACKLDVCHTVSMSNAIDPANVTFCTGTHSTYIGTPTTATLPVGYSFDMSAAGAPSATQTIPMAHALAWGTQLVYNAADALAGGPCNNVWDTCRVFRDAVRTCAFIAGFDFTYNIASYVVNSWEPFNMTVNFTNGNGLFSTAYTGTCGTMSGSYYSASVTVSE